MSTSEPRYVNRCVRGPKGGLEWLKVPHSKLPDIFFVRSLRSRLVRMKPILEEIRDRKIMLPVKDQERLVDIVSDLLDCLSEGENDGDKNTKVH